MGWNLGTSNPNEVGVTWNQGNPTTGNMPNRARQQQQAMWEEQMMAQRAAQAQAQAQAMQRMQGPLGAPRDFGLTQGQAIPNGSQGGAPVVGYDPSLGGVNMNFPNLF